jgi:hypothetical protein
MIIAPYRVTRLKRNGGEQGSVQEGIPVVSAQELQGKESFSVGFGV